MSNTLQFVLCNKFVHEKQKIFRTLNYCDFVTVPSSWSQTLAERNKHVRAGGGTSAPSFAQIFSLIVSDQLQKRDTVVYTPMAYVHIGDDESGFSDMLSC